ncbi:MAG TPA: GrpB family protein [Candidatus Dormibacteraeota bacterium]
MIPGFEVVPNSERGFEPMTLVAYDSAWPRRFDAWRRKLVGALRSSARRIDHVGSTAIPGLLAKDTIDIQISVVDMHDEPSYVPAIESLGIQLRIRDDDHRYFRPFGGRPRDVHVHVCDAGGAWERRHLLFVAYLRRDKAARERYAQAKLVALSRWADDRAAYTEAKDAVIREIEAGAEVWAGREGWAP